MVGGGQWTRFPTVLSIHECLETEWWEVELKQSHGWEVTHCLHSPRWEEEGMLLWQQVSESQFQWKDNVAIAAAPRNPQSWNKWHQQWGYRTFSGLKTLEVCFIGCAWLIDVEVLSTSTLLDPCHPSILTSDALKRQSIRAGAVSKGDLRPYTPTQVF